MTKINPYFFLLIVVVSFGCNSNQAKEMKVEEPIPFPTIVDTFDIRPFMDFIKEQNPKWLSTGNYTFNYIGPRKDSIFILPYISFNSSPRESLHPLMLPAKKYYLEYGEKRNYKNTTESAIEIRINTAKKTAGYYPIILTNIDSDTCFIGSLDKIPLIMEATNKKGEWKPIQSHIVGCGTDLGHVFLPPGYIVITLAPVFKGNYKTLLRLKLGKNYSNPFTGSIKYSQFEYKKQH